MPEPSGPFCESNESRSLKPGARLRFGPALSPGSFVNVFGRLIVVLVARSVPVRAGCGRPDVAEVQRRQQNLRHANERQKQVVAERAAARASVQSQLAQRRTLLSSIHGEIAQLQQRERERQAELKRQLQERLAAQQQAASQQAIAPVVSTAPTQLSN